MEMQRRVYDKEFKDNAVNMLLMSGKPLLTVARELGISDTALRAWRNEYLNKTDRHAEGGEGMPTPREMAEEIKRLKKELAHVTWQRDILKKTAAILSQQSPIDTK